jgi:hypothetical protein
MKRIPLIVAVPLCLVLAACSQQSRSTSAPAAPVSAGPELLPTVEATSPLSRHPFRILQASTSGSPPGVRIQLGAQRATNATGSFSLGVSVGLVLRKPGIVVGSPHWEIESVTATGGTSIVATAERGRELTQTITGAGFETQDGLRATVPRSTDALILVVHAGPSLPEARRGVAVRFPIAQIPSVPSVTESFPYPHSSTF